MLLGQSKDFFPIGQSLNSFLNFFLLCNCRGGWAFFLSSKPDLTGLETDICKMLCASNNTQEKVKCTERGTND